MQSHWSDFYSHSKDDASRAVDAPNATQVKDGIAQAVYSAVPEAGAVEAVGQTSFDVELTAVADRTHSIKVIQTLRVITGLSLEEAKRIVLGAPAVVKEGIPKADAEAMKAKIEEAGGSVTLK
ncbi:50S ribosomal protein L7/L12 [Diplonema papillatum]|nr:50S ribosomal protein L7/L12 [Diplonema papillatum]